MEYYHFKPIILSQYSPGTNVLFEINSNEDITSYISSRGITQYEMSSTVTSSYFYFDPSSIKFSEQQKVSYKKTVKLLNNLKNKNPFMNCFGLHEWAMLYSSTSSPVIKKQNLPLRLSEKSIRKVVDSSFLHCTHFDAYRFFTNDSKPLNKTIPTPTRDLQFELDQPGCIHVNMDLFKWAFKIFPFITSELLIDCLELALKARELDMRASPYDLTNYKPPSHLNKNDSFIGMDFELTPIQIELPEVSNFS